MASASPGGKEKIEVEVTGAVVPPDARATEAENWRSRRTYQGNKRLNEAQVRRLEAPNADRERGQEGSSTTRVGGEVEETGCRKGAVGCRERTGWDDKELAVGRRQPRKAQGGPVRSGRLWARVANVGLPTE